MKVTTCNTRNNLAAHNLFTTTHGDARSSDAAASNLARVPANLGPVQVTVVGFVDNLATAVEAEDVVANTARATRLHLVLVSEEFLSRKATTVVELSVSEHTQQRALARVDVAYHSDS